MAPLPGIPLKYEDIEETRTFQEIIDNEPVFKAPIRESETIDDYRYRIEQLMKDNVEEYPFLLCPKAQVYLASRNLEGEAWKELKALVEPYILYRYQDSMHPLRMEGKGVMRLADFIFLMRVEKVKYRLKERSGWYDYSNDDPNRPENLAVNHMSWDEPPYYLPYYILEKKRKSEREPSDRRVRAAVESPGGNPTQAAPGPSGVNGEGDNEVEPASERPFEEHPLLPILEAEEEAEEGGNEDGEGENGDDDEDPEEEDPEEEEEEEENLHDGYDSSVHYTVSSSSSSSPSAGSGFERQRASDYYTDSQNELDNEDEKYDRGFRR